MTAFTQTLTARCEDRRPRARTVGPGSPVNGSPARRTCSGKVTVEASRIPFLDDVGDHPDLRRLRAATRPRRAALRIDAAAAAKARALGEPKARANAGGGRPAADDHLRRRFDKAAYRAAAKPVLVARRLLVRTT